MTCRVQEALRVQDAVNIATVTSDGSAGDIYYGAGPFGRFGTSLCNHSAGRQALPFVSKAACLVRLRRLHACGSACYPDLGICTHVHVAAAACTVQSICIDARVKLQLSAAVLPVPVACRIKVLYPCR